MRGADVELLDAEQTRKAVGSAAYTGALRDRRAGTIQPLAYVRGLARAASEQGARFFTRSAATGYEDLGHAWKVTTATGSVTAPHVIVASDAYAQNVWTQLRSEQVYLPYFNLATRPLSDTMRQVILPNLEGVWDTRSVLSSYRFDTSGRLVFGSVGALRGPGAMIHRDWSKREMRRLFPQLAGVGFEHEWYGWIGMTDDAVPGSTVWPAISTRSAAITGAALRRARPWPRSGPADPGDMAAEDFSLPLSIPGRPSLRLAKEAIYEYGALATHLVGAR
jgi:glycine/D-amino acid oxidase-like deaminating enzyme